MVCGLYPFSLRPPSQARAFPRTILRCFTQTTEKQNIFQLLIFRNAISARPSPGVAAAAGPDEALAPAQARGAGAAGGAGCRGRQDALSEAGATPGQAAGKL